MSYLTLIIIFGVMLILVLLREKNDRRSIYEYDYFQNEYDRDNHSSNEYGYGRRSLQNQSRYRHHYRYDNLTNPYTGKDDYHEIYGHYPHNQSSTTFKLFSIVMIVLISFLLYYTIVKPSQEIQKPHIGTSEPIDFNNIKGRKIYLEEDFKGKILTQDSISIDSILEWVRLRKIDK